MATGFNTEFKFNARVYHVQTEDKGLANPTIQTLIYIGGEILDSFKSEYSDLLASPPLDEGALMRRMEDQHKRVVQDIKNAKYDPGAAPELSPEGAVFNDKPFLDAFLEHLEADGATEALELLPIGPLLPVFGTNFKFSVRARCCASGSPILGADVSAKLVSSLRKTYVMASGKTDANGAFSASIDLPPSQPGHCAIVVSCNSSYGNDEISALITT